MTLRLAESEYGLAEEEVRAAVHGCVSVTPYKPMANAYSGLAVLTQLHWLISAHAANLREADAVLNVTSVIADYALEY